MVLTDSERRKFAEYLEQDVESSKAILAQMEKLPCLELIAEKTRIEIAAATLIVKRLRDIESQSIR